MTNVKPFSGHLIWDQASVFASSAFFVSPRSNLFDGSMSQKLIDDFQQNNPVISSRGTSGEKGIGIGLKICKDFAENNNLTLTVQNEIGKGTSFELSVPRN